VTLKQILSENQDVILKNKILYCHSCEITIDCKTKHQTTRLSNHLKPKAQAIIKSLRKIRMRSSTRHWKIIKQKIYSISN